MMTGLAILMSAAMLAAPAPRSPRATVEAMFAAFNAHDPKAMARLYAPDAKIDSSDFCATRGAKDVERTYTSLFAAMPDLHDAVDAILVDGDRVAVRFTATSEKAGFRLPIMTMLRVRDGLIIEDDSRFDNGGRPCQA